MVSGLENVSSLRLVFIDPSSDDPWSHGTRSRWLCPFCMSANTLAESGLLELDEAAFLPLQRNIWLRATRLRNNWFIFCRSWSTGHDCCLSQASGRNFAIPAASPSCHPRPANASRFRLIFLSFRHLYRREIMFLQSFSGREPLGEHLFEEEAGALLTIGTFVPGSLTRCSWDSGLGNYLDCVL